MDSVFYSEQLDEQVEAFSVSRFNPLTWLYIFYIGGTVF